MKRIKVGTYRFTRRKDGTVSKKSSVTGTNSWDEKIELSGLNGKEFDVVLVEKESA